MEVNYQEFGPLQGGWFAECNQDFRQGAKELNSLHPVSSLLPNSSIHDGQLDDWMETRETLGYNGLEAFSDVILYAEQEFGPDLFQAHGADVAQQGNAITDTMFNVSGDSRLSDTSYDTLVCEQSIAETKEPKVTIRLKKIKVPKKKKSLTSEYAVCDYEMLANTPPQVNRSPPHDTDFFLSKLSNEDSIFTFDTDIDLFEYPQELVNSLDTKCDFFLKEEELELEYHPVENVAIDSAYDTLTLKDALGMENADFILDNYLSPRSNISRASPQHSDRWTNSPSASADQWANSPSAPADQWTNSPNAPADQWANSPNAPADQWANSPNAPVDQWTNSPLAPSTEVFSPCSETSAQCSYSEGVPSPSNSESYSLDSTLLTADSMEEDLHEPSTSKSKPRKSKREKMSPESRYLRKKEQNKQAALRYRVKKKLEDEHLLNNLKDEEETKMKLEKRHANLLQEVQFMKKLMRETFIAKKLVPPDAFD